LKVGPPFLYLGRAIWKTLFLSPPLQIRNHLVDICYTAIKVLGGGGVGEETLMQKGPSPTKQRTHFIRNQPHSRPIVPFVWRP